MTETPEDPTPAEEPDPFAGFLEDLAAERERLGVLAEVKRNPWYPVCICGHTVNYHTKGAGAPEPLEGNARWLWNDDWRGCRGVLIPKQVEKAWYEKGGRGQQIKAERSYPAIPPPYACECQEVRPVLEVRNGANFFRCSTSHPVDPLSRGIESVIKKCIEKGDPLSKRLRWLPETRCLNCKSRHELRPHRHLGATEPVILCSSCKADQY